MSTDPKLFPLLDEFDDFPYNSSLRIPPLQDPLPFTGSSRPSPLEPNARVDDAIHNATAKLTSRRKALAGAKLIGENDHTTTYEASLTNSTSTSVAQVHGSGKRQKIEDSGRQTEFVQLPKPVAKLKEAKPQPFQPVPIVNELHEPPPSAALFPPITTEAPRDDANLPRVDPGLFSGLVTNSNRDFTAQTDFAQAELDADLFGPVRRPTQRPRRKWSYEETQDLLKGVAIFGPGRWKMILNHPQLNFLAERTAVDLKDKYRTCRMHQERDTARKQKGHKPDDIPGNASVDDRSNSNTEHAERELEPNRILQLPIVKLLPRSSPLSLEPPVSSNPAKLAGITPVDVSLSWLPPTKRKQKQGPRPPEPYRIRRRKTPRWTEEEDANLIRGYQKHGFAWTAITKDPEMNLAHRIGEQVRDRFRLKFSEIYDAKGPDGEPQIIKREKKPRTSKIKRNGEPTTEKDCEEKSSESNRADSSKTSRARAPRKQLLPRSLSYKRSWSPTMESETPINRTSDPQASDGSASSDEESRDSSTADENRLMGIPDLLNDEEDHGDRLPSFKYASDDWGDDSVTLPPLLWEELATRPIFDLE